MGSIETPSWSAAVQRQQGKKSCAIPRLAWCVQHSLAANLLCQICITTTPFYRQILNLQCNLVCSLFRVLILQFSWLSTFNSAIFAQDVLCRFKKTRLKIFQSMSTPSILQFFSNVNCSKFFEIVAIFQNFSKFSNFFPKLKCLNIVKIPQKFKKRQKDGKNMTF